MGWTQPVNTKLTDNCQSHWTGLVNTKSSTNNRESHWDHEDGWSDAQSSDAMKKQKGAGTIKQRTSSARWQVNRTVKAVNYSTEECEGELGCSFSRQGHCPRLWPRKIQTLAGWNSAGSTGILLLEHHNKAVLEEADALIPLLFLLSLLVFYTPRAILNNIIMINTRGLLCC